MSFEPNLVYARERYGAVPESPSAERGLRFAKALLIIVGADGVSDREWEAYADFAHLMGAPESLIAELKAFDYRNAKLETYLDGLRDGPHARRMLYDAIRIAHADGYAAAEHELLLQAARLLGLDPSVVTAIEDVVAREIELARTRASLFATPDA